MIMARRQYELKTKEPIKKESYQINDVNNQSCDINDIEERREDRKLRHWVIKVIILSIVSVFIPTVLVFLWSYATSDTGTDSSKDLISSFIDAFVEIVHFMTTPIGND